MDVIDLSTTPGSVEQPGASVLSRFGPRHRLIGAAVLVLLALAGLRVNAVDAVDTPSPTQPGTATGPPVPAVVPVPKGPAARRTDGSLPTGTGSRLLLLGVTLTTFDVSSGAAARPFAGDSGASVTGAAALTDGDVVITSLGEASGRAYALEDGRRTDLGIATSAVPGLAVDTAWLINEPESAGPTRVRLVTLAGTVVAGPYAIPPDWRLERSVPGGVLLAVGPARAPYELHLWTPGSVSPGPVVADDVVTDASGGGRVLAVSASGAAAVDGTPVDLPGDALGYAVSPDGSTLAALEADSIVLTSRAGAAAHRVVGLPAGSQPTSIAFAPSGWLFASLGTRVVAVAPGAATLTDLPVVFSDPVSDLVAAAAIGQIANPRVGR